MFGRSGGCLVVVVGVWSWWVFGCGGGCLVVVVGVWSWWWVFGRGGGSGGGSCF